MEGNYDSVIVGASPFCMTEAYCRAMSGQRVALIERKDHIGGAWATIDSEFFDDVEYGTHLLFPPDPSVYEFVRDYLGWELESMHPPPEVVATGRRFRYSPRELLRADILASWDAFRRGYGVKEADTPTRGWWASWYDRRFRPVRNCLRYGLKYLKHADVQHEYLYPTGGTPVMLSSFRRQLAEADVDVRLGTALKSINVRKNAQRVSLLTDAGKLTARRLVLTTCSSTPDFRIDGEPLELPREQQYVNHLHLYVSGCEQRRFSYILFNKHPFLRRVSDVTRFARSRQPAKADRRALCVWVRGRSKLPHDEHGVQQIMKELVQLEYLPDAATVDGFHWSKYGGTHRENETLARIRSATSPLVQVVSSGNLVLSMRSELDRWQRLLQQAPTLTNRDRMAA